MRIDKLRHHYRELLGEISRQARAAGATVHASEPSVLSLGDGSDTKVTGFFYLKEWPYSSTSRKPGKKLDILMRSEEVYESESLRLVKSTIQLMYFSASTAEAVPNLGLHYDYEHKVGAAHPLFHAQFGSSTFSEEEPGVVRFSRTISSWKDLVRVRIPTVHIGLPAAFLSLFADHLPHENFLSFLNYARGHELYTGVTARMDCRASPLNTVNSSYFQAHHLYQ